jgi:pyruvate, water dikinase
VTGFDSLLALGRQVFPFVENHNFYVEQWHHSIFFNKARELGAVLVAAGLLEQDDDIYFLHRYEVYQVLYEAEARWALGVPTRSEYTWREEVARRARRKGQPDLRQRSGDRDTRRPLPSHPVPGCP